MIVIACLEAVALVVTVWLLLRHYGQREATWQQMEQNWTAERRELLNRIQRPEYVPAGTAVAFEIPEREADEWAKVGQIDISDDYGLGDEVS